jgi:AcrR family transcriptional regulator
LKRKNGSTSENRTDSTGTVEGMPKSPEPRPNSAWQERAVDRSLSSARAQALARSSQFLAAALDIVEENGTMDFTVQNVVDRTQLSLRAFYQHFAGKDDLLLALYEELVGQFIEELEKDVQSHEDPFEQLEAYVRGYLSRAHHSRSVGGKTISSYNIRLSMEHPADYARAVGPQLRLLASIIRFGVEREVFRSDLPSMTLAMLVNSALVSMAQMDVMEIPTSQPVGPDEVWAWCRSAVVPPAPADLKPKSRTRKARGTATA